jgi:hypothetical protein
VTGGVRRGSAAERLLGSWVRIPPVAWMFVSCTVFVLSRRGLCKRSIPRPEECYRLWCVSECHQVKNKNRLHLLWTGRQKREGLRNDEHLINNFMKTGHYNGKDNNVGVQGEYANRAAACIKCKRRDSARKGCSWSPWSSFKHSCCHHC